MNADADNRSIVVFDTNVIEGRYLTALLKGEQCRDFESLRREGYQPAYYVKSFYEICSHIKNGSPRFPWMDPKFGFPGGLDEGRRILSDSPDMFYEENFLWKFGLCEEWRGRDWEEYARLTAEFVIPDEKDAALEDVQVDRRFAEWKFALSAFCWKIWDAMSNEMETITMHNVFGGDPIKMHEAFRLEQELALESLIPSEDFEILLAALMTNASGFITQERKILSATALSLSLNHKTAFVHPDQLQHAIQNRFQIRWSLAQVQRRSVTDSKQPPEENRE